MKKNILIIYYSQTGQLRDILNNLFTGFEDQCHVDFLAIKPLTPFPFPWTSSTFFDCMPESVQQIPEPIRKLDIPQKSYDLVVLGYQPWFLSPSIPVNSFLKSPQAEILKGKRIITVIGSRNMWLNAQEQVKQDIRALGGFLSGNIVLFDRHPNLISILTVIRWSFKGQKEASRWLPEAGILQADILQTRRFGPPILQAIEHQTWDSLHGQLLGLGAVELNPALIVLEARGIANFRKFSHYILEKGKRMDPARASRVRLFSRLLIAGVFILSPISTFTARLQVLLNRKKIMASVDYFKSIDYREKAI